MAPRFGFAAHDDGRAARIQGYMEEDRLAAEQSRQSDLDSYRAQEESRKAQSSDWRREVAEGALALKNQHEQVQSSLRELETKQHQMALDKAQFDVNHQKEVLDQADKWRQEAVGVDLTAPDARQKLTELAAKYPKYHSDPDSRAIDAQIRSELVHNEAVSKAATASRTAAQITKARTTFDAAQEGLSGAYKAADDFRAQKENEGKPIPAWISDKIGRFEDQIPRAGAQLAKLDPDSADDVADSVKQAAVTSLRRQHDDLQSKFVGGMKPADVAALVDKINPIKAKLGFDQLRQDGTAMSKEPSPLVPAAPASIVPGPTNLTIQPDAATPAPGAVPAAATPAPADPVPAAPSTPGVDATDDSGQVPMLTQANDPNYVDQPDEGAPAKEAPVSPYSFPADSDFHNKDLYKNNGEVVLSNQSQSTFIPHAVPSMPDAVGTVDLGDGYIGAFGKDGKSIGTLAPKDDGSAEALAYRTAAKKPYDDLHSTADDAIKSGAPADAVKQRLVQLGGNPARLTYDD